MVAFGCSTASDRIGCEGALQLGFAALNRSLCWLCGRRRYAEELEAELFERRARHQATVESEQRRMEKERALLQSEQSELQLRIDERQARRCRLAYRCLGCCAANQLARYSPFQPPLKAYSRRDSPTALRFCLDMWVVAKNDVHNSNDGRKADIHLSVARVCCTCLLHVSVARV